MLEELSITYLVFAAIMGCMFVGILNISLPQTDHCYLITNYIKYQIVSLCSIAYIFREIY